MSLRVFYKENKKMMKKTQDGEASFYIKHCSVNTPVYSFKYSIGLHVDDINMLIFIQKNLELESLYLRERVLF